MRRQKADLFDHALMAAIVGFVIGALWVADASAQSYTTFPNLRSGNMDFTATIRANGSACASGTAIVSGGGSVTCVAVIPASEKGANSGVATLDSGGKVPTAQLPFSGLTYDGSWNATTNSPTLADGTGTSGHFYITSVAGTQNLGSGSITFAVGDWALYNGIVWQKVPSSAAVSSVFGRTGAVTATAGDYTATQVTNTPAGGIAATTAQAAINELDTEKQAAASTLTSWAALTRASGFDTFTQTPSSANLRGLLTDEVGTGAAYFVGGALGTPASATLTNGTGLPWSTGLTGVPTTASGYGITGGAKLDAYAGGDTPSAFTLGIVDSVDAAAWRSALGAGTSSFSGSAADLTGTLADARLSSNVPLKNAANIFSATQTVSYAGSGTRLSLTDGSVLLDGYISSGASGYLGTSSAHTFNLMTSGTERIAVGPSGNVTIAAPSSGATLALTGLADVNSTTLTDGTRTIALATGSGGYGLIGTTSAHAFRIYSGNASRIEASSAGNVTVNAPSSGTTATVSSLSGSNALQLSATTGAASLFGGGWNVGLQANAWNWLTQSTDPLAIGTAGAASLNVYTNGSQRINLTSAGNATLATPTSGNSLTVNNIAGNWALLTSDGTASSGLYNNGASGSIFGTSSNHPLSVVTNAVTRMAIGTAGNVTVNAPSSGATAAVTVIPDAAGVTLSDGSRTLGLGTLSSGRVFVGANSSAVPLAFYANAAPRMELNNGLQVGSPTGGDKGSGTINTAGDIAINNVSVCRSDGTNCPAGGGVSSITGTANQVIASASTGAITLSTPQSIGTASSVQFGSFGVGTAASGTTGEIRATNNVTAYYSSDRRLKQNIQAIPNALSKVEQIRGVTFDWTPEYIASHGGEDGYFTRKHDVGVIAQEVEAVLPEVVATREDGYKAVKYDRLVALLIESVKDLKAQNDELYERVKKLEGAR